MDYNQRLCSSAVHSDDTNIDVRGAKYRSDTYMEELQTYTHTFRAGGKVGGGRDLRDNDVFGRYYILTDAVVVHIAVRTTTTWYRAPPSERCR